MTPPTDPRDLDGPPDSGQGHGPERPDDAPGADAAPDMTPGGGLGSASAGAGAGAKAGASESGSGSGSGDGSDALDGLTSEEAQLRAMMQGAVAGLYASPDALEHLRRAVPVRRQRKRQAMLGAAAAVLLVGLAVPAVVRAAGTSGTATATPADAGNPYSLTPDAGDRHKGGTAGPSGTASTAPGTGSKPSAGLRPTGAPVDPTGTLVPVPDCASGQLGKGASSSDSPDSGGRVYGWFRVANVSQSSCTVTGGGVVQAVAHGSADQAAIQVVGHTKGDPASRLPTAVSDAGPIVLRPGQDYEVAFAWVPDDTSAAVAVGCTAATTSPATPSTTPSATTSAGSDQGTAAGGTTTGAGQPPDGEPTSGAPAASVALNHTPAAGSPVVTGPVIKGACAGTVYTTPAMAEPDGTPAP